MALRHTLAALMPRPIALNIKYLSHSLSRLKNHQKKVSTSFKLITITKKNAHVFFGYYDVSPFNPKSGEIIYNVLKEKENQLHLILSNLIDYKELEIGITRAWNWQQGCRLRWMPRSDREIVFNDFDGKDYFARIFNVDTKAERRIDAPLYDISPDGKFGLSIDFERLGVKRPGYGYSCRVYKEQEHDLMSESIDLIDIQSNTRKKILTYNDITRIKGCETSDIHNNYINHLCFSPSGKRFLFFWLTADSSWHKAYLLVHNLENQETKLLEGCEKVSHYVWQDDDNIICTAANEKQQWHYYNYNINTGAKTVMNADILNVDGHPSIFNERQILTDTYPNLQGFQKLYLAGKETGDYLQLIEIYSNCKMEGEKRTDLHPRLDTKMGIVCFDANVGTFRSLNFIKL